MAIWPFGRKSKRHTIHVDAATPDDLHLAQDSRHSLDDSKIGKPTRAHSKRQKNRHSQPVDDYSHPYQNATLAGSQQTQFRLPSSQTDPVHPIKGARTQTSSLGHHADGYVSYSTICREQPTMSRKPSLLKTKQNGNSPAVLKKRLSKRKAYEIAREREIRLMASSPIDIPRRSTTPLPGDYRPRRSDRQMSDLNLSVRDSAASSISEFSDTYTFKVNGFAAWTPRPVIRYVEAPRTPSRSQKSPDPAARRDKTPAITASEEHLHARKRVDRLADGLDAGGLRELLERDRRRTERKQIEDQEKLQRKLHRAAEQQKSHEQLDRSHQEDNKENQAPSTEKQTRTGAESRAEDDVSGEDSAITPLAGAPASSWLRDGSIKETERSALESVESVNVIGNLDDSSIRERKLNMRSSFAPSQEMGMSRSTLASRSPSRQGLGSPTSSQMYGMGRDSTSDMSRTVDSERRLSEHSAGHANSITSIFRRGSSRLKRRYRERFQERSPEITSTSFESFSRVSPPPTAAPPPFVPPRAFIPTGTIKRSQSKFTEHFSDEPLSPPDSRLQSPDIPEEPMDSLEMENDKIDKDKPDSPIGTQYPIPGTDRQNSWTRDSLEGDVDNVPLSQSLASIDSEGSWMSGQFLRHISQRKSNPVRPSIGSLRNRMESGEESPNGDEASAASVNPDLAQATSKLASDQDNDLDIVDAAPPAASAAPAAPEKTEETWHDQIAKRPVLVTPSVRPKSTEGLLNNVRSLSPISAEVEFSPIEEHSAEVFLADEDAHENGRR